MLREAKNTNGGLVNFLNSQNSLMPPQLQVKVRMPDSKKHFTYRVLKRKRLPLIHGLAMLLVCYTPTTMFDGAAEIVIQGVTASGEKFRPSDWAERLCGMMSVFGEDRQLSYSPYLKPVTIAGTSCVVVDCKLVQQDAAAYKFLITFAQDNELQLRPGRQEPRPESETSLSSTATSAT